MTKEDRKHALTHIGNELKEMLNEDIERVIKLAKMELKQRTMLTDVVGEIDKA